MTGRQLALVDQDGHAFGGPAPVAAGPIATSGRTEYTVRCPGCAQVHRHTRPGIRRAPCGALYTIPAAGPAGPARERSA